MENKNTEGLNENAGTPVGASNPAVREGSGDSVESKTLEDCSKSASGAQTAQTRKFYVCSKDDVFKGWMDGCMVWWRPEGRGYTYDVNLAGIFTEADMEKNYPPRESCHYIPKELIDRNCYSPRLAYWSRGRISGTLGIYEAITEATR